MQFVKVAANVAYPEIYIMSKKKKLKGGNYVYTVKLWLGIHFLCCY